MADLFCFGEVLWDVYKNRKGTEKKVGGAIFNVAAIASILDIETVMVTAVGKGKPGHDLLEEINKLGVRTICQVNEKPTGRVTVTLGRGRRPSFRIAKDSAYDYIRYDKEMDYISTKAKVFCFGTLAQRKETSRKTLKKLLDTTAARVVYDVTLREDIKNWKELFVQSLHWSDIVTMSDDELKQIRKIFPGKKDDKDLLHFLCTDFGVKKIFVTRGSDGASLFTADGHYMHAKTKKVKTVDTTGCGDAFTAAVISALLNDFEDKSMLEYATKLAARVAKFKGAIPDKLV